MWDTVGHSFDSRLFNVRGELVLIDNSHYAFTRLLADLKPPLFPSPSVPLSPLIRADAQSKKHLRKTQETQLSMLWEEILFGGQRPSALESADGALLQNQLVSRSLTYS